MPRFERHLGNHSLVQFSLVGELACRLQTYSVYSVYSFCWAKEKEETPRLLALQLSEQLSALEAAVGCQTLALREVQVQKTEKALSPDEAMRERIKVSCLNMLRKSKIVNGCHSLCGSR